ncbi:MAG TPA: tRNA (adenosine(37)-N6)-dimethylallyltransferase MiaA [Acidimicrobiales bacterium]|nr:tRNA (adenosine(37)-N6)-dimethylallyltransferase MiaA [Acidimicrobiales bacterium]
MEIVSVDSMQVYRGMDIGTAKPTPEERAEVRHHLVDLVDPTDDFSVAEFQRLVKHALADVEKRGNRAILVGGTGLYVRSVVDDLDIPGQWPEVRAELEQEAETPVLHARLAQLDPVAATRMEPTNRRRVVRALEVTLGSGRAFSSFGPGLEAHPATPRFFQIGLSVDRHELAERIERRFTRMIDDGLLEEVKALVARYGGRLSKTAKQALGYRELLAHLEGRTTLDEAIVEAVTRTRQFAVRQERWFRRDPRISWYDATTANIDDLAERVLGDWEQRCEP